MEYIVRSKFKTTFLKIIVKTFILSIPGLQDHFHSIEHVEKSLNTKYGGFPSNMRRDIAKAHHIFFFDYELGNYYPIKFFGIL